MRSVLICTTLIGMAVHAVVAAPPPFFRPLLDPVKSSRGTYNSDRDLVSKCERKWFDSTVDHFSAIRPAGGERFKQRYFVCDIVRWKPDAPIFFYVGNEADVTLYLNATGLMWESAQEFGALLVFAEHRYYGESKPFSEKQIRQNMQFLTAEQALADYASLISHLKSELQSRDSAVIGFGGSYGGMLAAWFRMKNPNILDGAIASSAPIWSFYDLDPPYDDRSFAQIVSRDASAEGGSAAACPDNMRRGWSTLFEMGKHRHGRRLIGKAMGLCPHAHLDSEADVMRLAQWLQEAWDYMAMGNFPYDSEYILNGLGTLPAYPVRVACQELAEPQLSGVPLLTGLAHASSVFYNYSGSLECLDFNLGVNNATSEDGEFWWYQSCTGQSMPFSRDGVNDSFWAQPNDSQQTAEDCIRKWGVAPRTHWPALQWLGRDIGSASNIVFCNGLLDPWSGGGVMQDVGQSIKAITIPEGAHHLDLFFADEKDPQSVRQARQLQRAEMHQWIRNKAEKVAIQRGWPYSPVVQSFTAST